MKIVIATGIYPPDIGGPSIYAQELKKAFEEKGHQVSVATYGALMRFPTGIRHLFYFVRVARQLRKADVCVGLDTFSSALPALIACKIFRVPFFIRTGGDFVWESYIERTKDPLPLSRFYSEHKPLTLRERLVIRITGFVVRSATMIFSTRYQEDIWKKAYAITAQTHIVRNAIGATLEQMEPINKNYLWYVRDVAVKNPERVHRAFTEAQKQYPEIVLEKGRVSHDELLKRIQASYAVVLPSVCEVSPNYIIDALRAHKPFIVTRECGEAWLGQYGRVVDPLNETDLQKAFEELASPDGYTAACEKVKRFSEHRPYTVLADEFMSIISRV